MLQTKTANNIEHIFVLGYSEQFRCWVRAQQSEQNWASGFRRSYIP
jgi:hypothetical protein